MSISWGVKERFKFIASGALNNWDAPSVAGVYAITYKRSPENPKAHTVLYFGQAGNLSQDAPDQNRRVLEQWTGSGNEAGELLVFVHPMPGSSSGDRSRVQEQLIAEYRPAGNRH
jgi:hypothetical protein